MSENVPEIVPGWLCTCGNSAAGPNCEKCKGARETTNADTLFRLDRLDDLDETNAKLTTHIKLCLVCNRGAATGRYCPAGAKLTVDFRKMMVALLAALRATAT